MDTKAKMICGIDLGTATCQVARITNTGLAKAVEFSEGGTSLPSVVYFQGDEPVVGREAENLLLVEPANGVRHWKRFMGKEDVLFCTTSGREYRAKDIATLLLMFDRRCQGYEAVGYTVLLPGSAVPDWPSEIPLPVDPQWKSDYAATVRRLVRDGVDAPLAKLFVHVARKFDSSARGAERARSASEAFLYRRLQSLAATAGRFELNVELPIPFDGWGNMEVDLLDPSVRLIVELDGEGHFANEEAYRRDRRKDALLQEHGYFVLRFLVEDVGSRLDHVLDAILRVLTLRDREIEQSK